MICIGRLLGLPILTLLTKTPIYATVLYLCSSWVSCGSNPLVFFLLSQLLTMTYRSHRTMTPKGKIQRYKDLVQQMAGLLSQKSYSSNEWKKLHEEAKCLNEEITLWKKALENESRWG